MATHAGFAISHSDTIVLGPGRWRLALVAFLALAALGWSGYLAAVSLGWIELGLCSSGSCSDLVLSSSWSRWLGLPVSLLAMTVYLTVLCVLPFTAAKDTVRCRAAWSVLVVLAFMVVGAAIWFVGLMTLHLGKSCGHCASMHLLGMVVASFLITMAPMGKQPAALRPQRVAALAAIALAALGLLVGGQLLSGAAMAATGQGDDAVPERHRPTPAAAPAPTTAADAATPQHSDPNTPEGKEALIARLKRDYGENWDKPTTACQMIPYFLSRPAARVTENTLYYEPLRKGSGPLPSPHDWVRIHFQGKLWSGQIFHDTFARGQPQDVQISKMIPGLADAITRMPVGSRWRLLLAPHQAYGLIGLPGVVPPDTSVFCEVELLDILPTTVKPDDRLLWTHQEAR